MVNRIFTGAHYGLRDWLLQRITAMVMAVYLFLLAGYLMLQPILDYDVWIIQYQGRFILNINYMRNSFTA